MGFDFNRLTLRLKKKNQKSSEEKGENEDILNTIEDLNTMEPDESTNDNNDNVTRNNKTNLNSRGFLRKINNNFNFVYYSFDQVKGKATFQKNKIFAYLSVLKDLKTNQFDPTLVISPKSYKDAFNNTLQKISLGVAKTKTRKVILFLFLLYSFTYLYLKLDDKTQIISSDNNRKYLKNIINMKYSTPVLMTFFLQQVIVSEKIKAKLYKSKVNYDRELLDTPDGGKISIDYHVKNLNENPQRLVIIMHGLTGGSETSYIKDIIEGLETCPNTRIACVNYRGINNTPLYNSVTYHCGFTDDFEFVLHHLSKKFSGEDLYVVGTSMGANIITKLLAKRNMKGNNIRNFNNSDDNYKHNNNLNKDSKDIVIPELPSIKGFISISNPFDCEELERKMQGGILDWYLLKRWKNYVKTHRHIFSQDSRIDIDKILSDDIKLYRDFDKEFTCKIFGFDNPSEYYLFNQSKYDLEKINVPTLCINSLDDKMSPIYNVDLSVCKFIFFILILLLYCY